MISEKKSCVMGEISWHRTFLLCSWIVNELINRDWLIELLCVKMMIA